jgi:hypothetical protein
MLLIALVGLTVNLAAMRLLARGKDASLNVKGVQNTTRGKLLRQYRPGSRRVTFNAQPLVPRVSADHT